MDDLNTTSWAVSCTVPPQTKILINEAGWHAVADHNHKGKLGTMPQPFVFAI